MTNRIEQPPDLAADNRRKLLEKILREKAQQTREAPLSFAQQRLWFLDQLTPQSATYNVPTLLRLHGPLDLEAFRAGLNTITKRHESLRTTFSSRAGAPVQTVHGPRSVDCAFVDLSRLDASTRKNELARITREEVRRPFDLGRDMPIRAMVVRVSAEEYFAVLVLHHIAADEWSLRVLFQEWGECYAAHLGSRAPQLPDLTIQYTDFAEWQHDWLNSRDFDRQLSYWVQKLKGPLPVLQLPADRPRPATQSYRGELFTGEIPPELADQVRKFSEAERTSLFMTLLAVFKVLLFRYSGQEDLIVGSPIAGRNRIELEGLIGFFVNTLPLRSSLQGEPAFRDFLQGVRETTLGAYGNQDVPFDKLVEHLQPGRNPNHMPLVQAVFSLDREFVQPDIFPGIKSEVLPVDTGTSKFDLTFVATDTGAGIRVGIEYNIDLFEAERISRLFQHYQNLLRAVLENPSCKVSELQLLSRSEEEEVVWNWNQTTTDFPRHQSIPQLFESQAAQRPDAVAIDYNGSRMSYRELNARANQLAHRLQSLGVGPNSLVGVYMQRGPEMITAFLAILKAGGAYVPLDLSYPRDRLRFMIEDTAMPVLLTHSTLVTDLPNSPTQVFCLDAEASSLEREPRILPASKASPENLAYVIYTSGSTGKPKGVAVPHRGVTRLVLNTDYIQIRPLERIAQASNASFDAATFEIWGALLNGGCIVGISKETAVNPTELAEALVQRRVQTLFLTTALFNQIAREAPGAFGTLDNLLFGGEAVDPKWVRAVLEYEPPKRLLHVYGPTESTTFASWHLVKEVGEDATTVPIGRPISNTELFILDRSLRPLPPGIPGELYVGGDGLAREYWNRPELTAERFVAHPFRAGDKLYRTGDLARFDWQGRVEYLGRIDHQVKIRGFRIELGEIESLLCRHPAIRQAVVLAREDVPGEKRLVAYIVPEGPAPEIGELRSFLRAELPDYMVPAVFMPMTDLPLTPNKKVDRKALPAPDHTRPDLGREFVAPRDGSEKKLAAIWEKILGVQPVGATDNFFELGGHSLLAVRLFSEIEGVFKRKLPLATLFRAPTVAEIARVIDAEEQEENWTTIVDIQPSGSQPPFFWIHSLGGDGGGGFFYYRKLAELLGPDQPSFGIRSPRQPFSRIEEMAAFYCAEIRKAQPHGPYSLGGFCFGGIVAYEMARQLTRAGENVAVLALLESAAPNVAPANPWNPSGAMHSIENLVENVKDFVNHSPREQLAFVRRKGQRLKQKLADKLHLSAEAAPKVELKEVLDLENYPKDYVKYAETHWQALTQFRPEPYQGKVHLFRAKKQGLTGFNHTLGWEALVADRVDVTVVPGTHESMLQEPNVQIVANRLKALLQDRDRRPVEVTPG